MTAKGDITSESSSLRYLALLFGAGGQTSLLGNCFPISDWPAGQPLRGVAVDLFRAGSGPQEHLPHSSSGGAKAHLYWTPVRLVSLCCWSLCVAGLSLLLMCVWGVWCVCVSAVTLLCVDVCEDIIVAGAEDGSVMVWTMSSCRLLHILLKHTGGPGSVRQSLTVHMATQNYNLARLNTILSCTFMLWVV